MLLQQSSLEVFQTVAAGQPADFQAYWRASEEMKKQGLKIESLGGGKLSFSFRGVEAKATNREIVSGPEFKALSESILRANQL